MSYQPLKMLRRSMNTVFEESNDGVLNSTNSSGNVLDRDAASSARQTKRYRVFREIVETEQNYVDVLYSILKDYKAEFLKPENSQWISGHEIHLLFSRIEHILEIHEKILEIVEREDRDWTGKNLIGHCFAHEKERLLKYYVPYINSYDEILEILTRIQMNSVGDHIIKCCDAKSSKKYTLKDLLIRPVQRLPSVTLLLKELQKATPKSNPDHPCIQVALEVIDSVLSKSNENRRNTDNYQQTLETINSIEHFPPDCINSNRSFYYQADFQVIHSNGSFFKKYRGSVLTFFLFNDTVVVAKRRNIIQSAYRPSPSRLSISNSLNTSVSDLSRTLSRSGSMSTLKRSLSFISSVSKPERKPFKFVVMLSFISFRQLMYIRQDGLFYLKLRDEMSDEMCALKIAEDTTVDTACNLMETLCDQINSTSKREVTLTDISNIFYNPENFNFTMHNDELDYIRKTRKMTTREYARPVFRFGGYSVKRLN